MTTIQAPQRQHEPVETGGHQRRWIIAVVGAAAIVLTVLVVILGVGYVPLPALPNLADNPDPSIPGTVAYLHDVGDARCIAVVPAGGGPATDAICRPVLEISELAWTGDGLLVFVNYAYEGPQVVLLDPETGDELDRLRWRDPDGEGIWAWQRARREDGARLLYEQRLGGEVVIRIRQPDGELRELLRLEGPADYAIVDAQWSPDGEWILATDSRGRLIVLAAAGEPAPRLLAESEGFPTAAWTIEGDSTYTVDPGTFGEP
jgi:hypothetical protein